jgi:putative peptidoglycan lipid II flippase
MALLRVVASTFYARHDTMTPARVTVMAIVVNIGCKVLFVWGLGFGIAGIALGTAIGAWVNVGLLAFFGSRRQLLRLDAHFWGSVLPAVIAAAVAGAAAYGGVVLARAFPHPGGLLPLVLAIVASSLAYGAVVLLFRNRLPLGRLAGARA